MQKQWLMRFLKCMVLYKMIKYPFVDIDLHILPWQHHGNAKSDSLYYLNNGSNTNSLTHIS